MGTLITFRKADGKDLKDLLDLIEQGFSQLQNSIINTKEGQEHRILFTYLYSRKEFDLNRIYLACENGRLVAAVGVFPQILSWGKVKIPVWGISPVVTHPEFRGRGLAGQCLSIVFEDLKKQGIPAVFLWGIPDFYPRFGFVPVLPRYKTKLGPGQLKNNNFNTNGRFRPPRMEDLKDISLLYNQKSPELWLQPERSLHWWQERFLEMGIEEGYPKEVPFPKKENFIIWENHQSSLTGYLYFEKLADRIMIGEAAAEDENTAIAMVMSFSNSYLSNGQNLFIRGTPTHSLNAGAYRLGGIHLNPAPLAGMIKIINWYDFLCLLSPEIDARLERVAFQNIFTRQFRLDGQGFRITISKKFEMEITNYKLIGDCYNDDNKLMIKLILGIYDRFDLKIFPEDLLSLITIAFPPKTPFIWDANYLY